MTEEERTGKQKEVIENCFAELKSLGVVQCFMVFVVDDLDETGFLLEGKSFGLRSLSERVGLLEIGKSQAIRTHYAEHLVGE